MRKCALQVLFVIGFSVSVFANVDDAQIRVILDRATRFIDNPYGSRAEIKYAISEAGSNTNRVVSLMKQMIDECANESTISFYLSEIGKYGTSVDLPFLYQRVGETNLSEHATMGVLNIEGLTTNSLARLSSLIPDERPRCRSGLQSWLRILDAARNMPEGVFIRNQAISNAVLYASRQTESVEMFDRGLSRADPTYRMSRRRLSVLRSVQDLGPNPWQTNFVTRAIRELEAYPESNLPD